MSAEGSVLHNLMHRRVPQIVGMYIAASWLVIELGDWITERSALPPNLTSYVFVAMLVMLPAVILFAYNHGAPGKDRWTRTEQVFIPLNAAIAVGILYFTGPSLLVEAATETVQVTDETGAVREFEVARQGYHREVVAFFWENQSGNSDLDWLTYGLPFMLSHDMNRVSPVITVETPLDSTSMKNELKDRGYESLREEPAALRVQIVRDRRSAAFVTGRFDTDGDTLIITATLTDAETGDEIGTHTVSADDWLAGVDDVSEALLEYLDVAPGENRSDDPVAQHLSDSLEALRHYTTGLVAIGLNNDFEKGIAELSSALEVDPNFAEASGELSVSYYLAGDIESARAAAAAGLKNSYRLSETSRFVLRANRYVFDGDYERALRVLDMWTEVQPNSTLAYEQQARLARLQGGEDGLTKAREAYDRLLELDPLAVSVYRQMSGLEQQRGDYEAAANYLRLYLESRPESADAHQQLAAVYQAAGDLEKAKASLEDAAVLADDPRPSELALARIEAAQGEYAAAEQRLAAQLSDALNPEQRVQVLSAQTEIALVRGQIERALGLHAEIVELSRSFMPPMVRLMNLENQRSSLLVLLGRYDEALANADTITAQVQPPFDSFMNFTYTEIYARTGDREAFRKRAAQSRRAMGQYPEVLKSFIATETAQIAIWDGDLETAVSEIDRAKEMFDTSLLQVLVGNLSSSSVYVGIAELYLKAGAPEKARDALERVLKVFPSYAYAKLTLAKVLIGEGDEAGARPLLESALEVWSAADADYVHRQEAEELLATL
ncbi:MAG TPA: tetratricopeptide repeat protein [Woeseiaceae bacterium]|nr:tetratricopeptide repeat protein [Woeseiaceae bacterium]